MSRTANHLRGEASIQVGDAAILLRPSFAALVAAEDELGPLFALVERAATGNMKIAELGTLFWHCRVEAPSSLTRDQFCEAVVSGGLVAATPALKILLGQILAGR